MINSLLFLLAAQADPALSLDLRARPLSEVLEAISKTTQIAHTTSPAHSKEIVLIRFKDRPLSEVRRKIAWALDATWTQNETGWTLARTDARRKEIEAASKATRRKHVDNLFDKVRERLKATPTSYTRIQAALKKSQSGNLDADWQNGPAGYWALQMWLDIGPDTITSMAPDQEIVFSDKPNSAQRQLPPAAMKSLTSMQEELLQLSQETKQVSLASEFGKRALKTIVHVSRTGTRDAIWLMAYGSSGELIYTVTMGSSALLGSSYDQGDQLGKRATAEFFELPPLQKEYERVREPNAERSSLTSIGTAKVKASDALIAALINPERIDPLTYWNSEALMTWAGEKSICVNIPDRLDFASRSCLQPGRFHLGKLKQIAEPVGALTTVGEPTWFLGRPVNPVSSEATRFDRAALGAFLRDSFENKAESADAYAKYTWTAGRQSIFFGFWTTVQKTLWRVGVESLPMANSTPYETWALIGSFGRSVKELEAGHLITYQQANPRQRVLMEGLIPYVEAEPNSRLVDLQLEPTEWKSASGLSPGSTFAVVGASEFAIQRSSKNFEPSSPVPFYERPQTAAEIGRDFARLDKVDLSTFGMVELGTRSRILTKFKPAESLVADGYVELGFFNKSKPLKATDLPADFFRAAEAARREARAKVTAGGR